MLILCAIFWLGGHGGGPLGCADNSNGFIYTSLRRRWNLLSTLDFSCFWVVILCTAATGTFFREIDSFVRSVRLLMSRLAALGYSLSMGQTIH